MILQLTIFSAIIYFYDRLAPDAKVYVCLWAPYGHQQFTRVIEGSGGTPLWNQSFTFEVGAHDDVRLTLYALKKRRSTFIGQTALAVSVPLNQQGLFEGEVTFRDGEYSGALYLRAELPEVTQSYRYYHPFETYAHYAESQPPYVDASAYGPFGAFYPPYSAGFSFCPPTYGYPFGSPQI